MHSHLSVTIGYRHPEIRPNRQIISLSKHDAVNLFPHCLVSRGAGGDWGSLAASGHTGDPPGYLDKHQLRGISLEHIRRDRILHEALATGADPLHLALVFNIDHTNAMAYANAARNLLSSPAEQVPSRRPK
jgi:hypothetical protein